MSVELIHLYLSPGHNFAGRHGLAPGIFPMLEVTELRCEAGRGIVGDRYFDRQPDFKGQITFFAMEVHEEICRHRGIASPSIYRRNVLLQGQDLNAWVGVGFEIQGVHFVGTEEASPCYWMDQVLGAGTQELMRGRGGLRARILQSGVLHPGPI